MGLEGGSLGSTRRDGRGIVLNEGKDGLRGQGRVRFRRILYVKPARSYEDGRETDMLSVYTKRS